ncbi:hypothetical protein ANAPC2_00760 [Anaplasma phagocytophilum]|nr:hypothetical protein ANAPC2_00760 [Anaplasma phagocytophilum]
MMLLLIRLTGLVMLLLRYPGRTLLNLLMLLLEFLIPVSVRRFVKLNRGTTPMLVAMVYMRVRQTLTIRARKTTRHYVVGKGRQTDHQDPLR